MEELRLNKNKEEKEKEDNQEYKFFPDAESRDDLFYFTQKVAEYLKENKIKNLILIDRAIRPIYVGLQEYWKAKYPYQEKFKIYFINPWGIENKEDLSDSDLKSLYQKTIENLDDLDILNNSEPRSKEEIEKEFREKFSQLIKEKDEPLLILDACLHEGVTISKVKDFFRNEGFSKIFTGVLNLHSQESKFEPDFYLKIPEEKDFKKCFPFGDEILVAKTLKSVNVITQNKEYFQEAKERRREIRRIIKEKLVEENNI